MVDWRRIVYQSTIKDQILRNAALREEFSSRRLQTKE